MAAAESQRDYVSYIIRLRGRLAGLGQVKIWLPWVMLLEPFPITVEILNVIRTPDMKLPSIENNHYKKTIVNYRESLVICEQYLSMKEIVDQVYTSFLR
ncbi:hypothetical protein M0802_000196 [Mischocyttarus mexicanus]|nr:hypothetical protein M0802_000196 [Mischocyttarus mexicanus]